jgi:hypothetical protein
MVSILVVLYVVDVDRTDSLGAEDTLDIDRNHVNMLVSVNEGLS